VKSSVALLSALSLVGTAARTRAEGIGVIIVSTEARDAALADNLTEVALARIAETPGRTLVGTAELRRRLGAESGRDIAACLERRPCLDRVAVSLGVSRLFTGAVRVEPGRFFLHLNVTDVSAARPPMPLFRQIDGSLPALIRAVQDGVDDLLDPRRAPGQLRVRSVPEGARVTIDDLVVGTTPLVSTALAAGPHRLRVEAERRFAWKSVVDVPPGRQVDLQLGPQELPPRRTWASYLGYGAAGGAVICAGAGVPFGILARVPPGGATREDAQVDLDRRTTYGRLGTGFLVSAAVLGVVSGLVFWRYWRDIVAR
jgi:hypothetical protein